VNYIRNKSILLCCVLLLFVLLTGGCTAAQKPKEAEEQPEKTIQPTLALTPTAVPTLSPAPTSTPIPSPTPTNTPTVTPTNTPSPTPTVTNTPTPSPTMSILEKIDEFEGQGGNLQKILTADAFLLVNMTQDDVLYSYNASKVIYPASITKLMTAYLALEYGNLDDVVTFSQTAVTRVIPDAMMCGFKAGDQISLRDLLICMLLFSGNDTAVAVAEHISGSEERFVELMNETAEKLGMTETFYCNSHGLPDDAHVTSA